MGKKYELLADSKIEVFGRTLFRIKALVSFSDVEAGEEGGFVECEGNLDHDGAAWVFGDARVFGAAQVSGAAEIKKNAPLYQRRSSLHAHCICRADSDWLQAPYDFRMGTGF